MNLDYLIFEFLNMFNINLFNNALFNQAPNTLPVTVQDDVVYNDFWLVNDIYKISKISYDNGPSIESQTFNTPQDDWWWELNYFFRSRIVTVEGRVSSDTAENFNKELDRFKSALWENDKNLDIKVNWTIRRAKASVINMNSLFDRMHFNITYIKFIIQFRVLAPFFNEIWKQNLDLLSQTWNISDEVLNEWTIKTDPIVQLNFTSATTVNIITFNIDNRTITVNETISWWDIVKIDCIEKIVTINWDIVDYDWIFPELQTWANLFAVTVNWTKNYDFNIYFFKQYI